MDKYYTPEIEEFYIGFEYEWLNEDGIWIKESSPTEISEKDFDEQTYGLRVKYLDKEDIESLGFKLIQEGDSFSKLAKIYFLKKEDGFNTGIDYRITTYSGVNTRIMLQWVTYSSYQNNNGELQFTIKNKSELKKLLKQLNINEN